MKNTTRRDGFTYIFLLILVPLIYLSFSYLVLGTVNPSKVFQALTAQQNKGDLIAVPPVACTMEAKQCPDGSFVGRSGPKCEFAPCPNSQNDVSTVNWKIFTSAKYNYSFKYPSDWYSNFYDESKSLAGTNTISNYETTDIQKYSNHGMIDYSKLNKTIEKIEITVLDGFNEDTTGLSESKDALQIGNYPTQTFIQSKQTEMYFRELKTALPSGKTLVVVITTHNKSGDVAENELNSITKEILSTFNFDK